MAGSSPQPAGTIFISYRRHETAYPAGWLFDRLTEHYGAGRVFKDVDSIELGDDFVEVVTRAVGSCDVLLALIGSDWVTVRDEGGGRRLDNPNDFVRIEIQAALDRNVRVIPILVDGATMPEVEQLPEGLAGLARRQALELSPSRFDFDTTRLVKVLDRTLRADHAAAAAGDAPAEAVPSPEVLATVGVPILDPVLDLEAPEDDPAPVEAPPHPPPPPPPPDPLPQHAPSPPPPVPQPQEASFRIGAPPPAPQAQPASTPPRSRWPLLVGLGAAALVVVVVAAALLWPSSDTKPGEPDVPPSATRGGGTQVVTVKVGRNSSGVAVGPQDVWVSSYGDGTVSRLDPASGQVSTTIPVGRLGGDVVACPDAAWVISDGRFVARIDAATRKVSGRFQLGSDAVDLAVRCGDAVWASTSDGTISRIRQGASGAEGFLSAGPGLADIDVDPQGILWVSRPDEDDVLRIDPATRKIEHIAVGQTPVGVHATSSSGVWVTSSGAATVSRIDPATRRVASTASVGRQPWGTAVGLGAAWVTNLGGDSVSRVDLGSGKVTTIPVGSKPDGIAVSRDAVWVANGGSGTVSRITP